MIPDYTTLPTHSLKREALHIPLCGEGSGSVPYSVKTIKFTKRGQGQEQIVTVPIYCTGMSFLYPFRGEGSNSIPSSV
jgi:hypothetical protein